MSNAKIAAQYNQGAGRGLWKDTIGDVEVFVIGVGPAKSRTYGCCSGGANLSLWLEIRMLLQLLCALDFSNSNLNNISSWCERFEPFAIRLNIVSSST